MAFHYRTQGFFLKKEARGEADFLFTVYTKDFGKLGILGKAIRKIKSKLRAGAREFCKSEIEFIQGKTYKTLTDTILIEDFTNIKKDLEKLKIAYQISEVLDSLVHDQEKNEKVWHLLNEVFKTLNNYSLPTTHHPLIYHFFLWNLLVISGYQPQLYNCVLCEKKLEQEKLYWSSKEGGVICKNCFNKISEKLEILEIEPDIIKILRFLIKNNWQRISKLKLLPPYLKNLKTISDDYFSYISGSSLDRKGE